jgi:hypothetical protein
LQYKIDKPINDEEEEEDEDDEDGFRGRGKREEEEDDPVASKLFLNLNSKRSCCNFLLLLYYN